MPRIIRSMTYPHALSLEVSNRAFSRYSRRVRSAPGRTAPRRSVLEWIGFVPVGNALPELADLRIGPVRQTEQQPASRIAGIDLGDGLAQLRGGQLERVLAALVTGHDLDQRSAEDLRIDV